MPKPIGAGSLTVRQDDALATIRDCLQGLRFGSLAITIHDGRIVQLDITEKRRISR